MVEMKDTKLPAIDLNLLLVLHTVLSEESATGAARKLNVTQSAVSNGLARLREVFDDPLFVRTGRGLVPTPRAEALRPMLASAIELLERTTEGENFDPKRTTREFSLACGDNHYLFELPRIVKSFNTRMPQARLRVVSVEYAIASEGLASDLEIALGPPQAATAGLHFEPLFEESAALVAWKENRKVVDRLTVDQFNSIPYVDVHLAFGRPGTGNRLMMNAMAEVGLFPQDRTGRASFHRGSSGRRCDRCDRRPPGALRGGSRQGAAFENRRGPLCPTSHADGHALARPHECRRGFEVLPLAGRRCSPSERNAAPAHLDGNGRKGSQIDPSRSKPCSSTERQPS